MVLAACGDRGARWPGSKEPDGPATASNLATVTHTPTQNPTLTATPTLTPTHPDSYNCDTDSNALRLQTLSNCEPTLNAETPTLTPTATPDSHANSDPDPDSDRDSDPMPTQDDATPPELIELTLDRSEVDVSSRPATITVSARVSDDLSGADDAPDGFCESLG